MDILESQKEFFSLIPDKVGGFVDHNEVLDFGKKLREIIEEQQRILRLVGNPFVNALPMPAWSELFSSSTSDELFTIELGNGEKYLRVCVFADIDQFVFVGTNVPPHINLSVGVGLGLSGGQSIILNVEELKQIYVRTGLDVSGTNKVRFRVSAWI